MSKDPDSSMSRTGFVVCSSFGPPAVNIMDAHQVELVLHTLVIHPYRSALAYWHLLYVIQGAKPSSNDFPGPL